MRLMLIVLLLLAVALPASALERHYLAPGDSLKLKRNGAYEIFNLRDIRTDTLWVTLPDGTIQHISLYEITGARIYMKMPRATAAARGGTIGFFVGAVGGFVIGSLFSASDMCAGYGYMCLCDHWAECGVMTGIVFALGGTVVGGLIGAVRPGMYWEPVELPLKLNLESGSRQGWGTYIALSFICRTW